MPSDESLESEIEFNEKFLKNLMFGINFKLLNKFNTGNIIDVRR